MRIIIYSLLIGFLLSSCVDLETKPLDRVPAESVFANGKGLQNALTGAYNVLQEPSIAMDVTLFADVAADNMTHIGTKKEYRQLSDNLIDPSNTYVEGVWWRCFDGINRVNHILENINVPQDISEETRNIAEGEARFLRAYLYSALVKYFGGVPIREKPTKGLTEEELLIPRATLEQTYQFIIDELVLTEGLLAGTTIDNSSYANIGAVKALLARVYLYSGDYSNAAEKSLEVLSLGYELELEDYGKIFDEEANSPEIIFQIDFTKDDDASNQLADWTQPFGRFEMNAWANDSYTNSIAIDFAPNDARRDSTISSVFLGGKTEYHSNKYQVINKDNVIVLRLAEMYLIRAEALNELGYDATGEAFARLNVIRQRANLSLLSSGNTPDQDAFREAVINERRFEFAFEGHRLFDLKRSGQIDMVLPKKGNLGENDWLLPIPQSELDTNPIMEQNGTY